MSNNSLAYKQIVKMYRNKFEYHRLKATNIVNYIYYIKLNSMIY